MRNTQSRLQMVSERVFADRILTRNSLQIVSRQRTSYRKGLPGNELDR